MSLVDGKGTLSTAMKDLIARWHDVQGVWHDTQSAEFEKTYLFQLENDVRVALGALDSMNQVIHKVESDCE